MLVSHDRLRRFICDMYVAKGVPLDEASVVAARQVEANLVGHDSHGVIKTRDYIKAIEKGHIVPGAPFEVVNDGPLHRGNRRSLGLWLRCHRESHEPGYHEGHRVRRRGSNC